MWSLTLHRCQVFRVILQNLSWSCLIHLQGNWMQSQSCCWDMNQSVDSESPYYHFYEMHQKDLQLQYTWIMFCSFRQSFLLKFIIIKDSFDFPGSMINNDIYTVHQKLLSAHVQFFLISLLRVFYVREKNTTILMSVVLYFI